jgi:hypothetical protein
VRNVGGAAGLKGGIYGLCGSRWHGSSEEGDEHEPEPEQSFIEVHICLLVYAVPFFCVQNIRERDEQNSLKLQLVLFHRKCNVSTNN